MVDPGRQKHKPPRPVSVAIQLRRQAYKRQSVAKRALGAWCSLPASQDKDLVHQPVCVSACMCTCAWYFCNAEQVREREKLEQGESWLQMVVAGL